MSSADDPLDRTICHLRPQRALLHCPVPPILLLAIPLPVPPTNHDSRWCRKHPPAWHARCPAARVHLPEPLQRWRPGAGESQQDGLDGSVGDCRHLLPSHGIQADPQRPPAGLRLPVASRGRYRGSTSCRTPAQEEVEVARPTKGAALDRSPWAYLGPGPYHSLYYLRGPARPPFSINLVLYIRSRLLVLSVIGP